MNRKAPDAALEANDVLYIPDASGPQWPWRDKDIRIGGGSGPHLCRNQIDHHGSSHVVRIGAPDQGSRRNLTVPADAYWAQPLPIEGETGRRDVPLYHYIWLLRRHGWRILAFVTFSMSRRCSCRSASARFTNLPPRLISIGAYPRESLARSRNQTATPEQISFWPHKSS